MFRAPFLHMRSILIDLGCHGLIFLAHGITFGQAQIIVSKKSHKYNEVSFQILL